MAGVWAALGGLVVRVRRLRVEVVALALLLVLLSVTSFVFSSGPRLADRAWQAGLTYELRTATPAKRGIETIETRPLPTDADPDRALLTNAAAFEAGLPTSIRRLINERSVVVTSLLFNVTSVPVGDEPVTMRPQTLRLRAQTMVADHLDVVAGRLPKPTVDIVESDHRREATYEIALSPETAGAMGLSVGDEIGLQADNRDGGAFGLGPAATVQLVGRVVGLVRAHDRSEPYWFGNLAIDDPDINPLTQRVNGVALSRSGALETLGQGDNPFGFEIRQRFGTDPAAARLDQLDLLRADLQRLAVRFRGVGQGISLRTGLPAILGSFAARRAPAEAVLTVASVGALAVALLAVAVVSRLLATRRREGIHMWRTRGASRRQLVGGQVLEAVALGLGAAAIGNLASAALWPGQGAIAGRLVAAAVGAASVAILTVVGSLAALDPLEARRETAPEPSPSRRRLVVEATVAALAVGGLYLLRLRGLVANGAGTAAAAGATPSGPDPLLAAVPVLLGVALGLVAIRVFPFPVRVLGWMAAGRTDLVPALGLRQVGRAPGGHTLTLLVVLLAMAVATFASVITTTIERGQSAAAWLRVGADYELEGLAGTPLPDNVSLDDLPGVTASSRALVAHQVGTSLGGFGSSTTLLGLDTARYAAVTADTPADPRFPAIMTSAPPDGAGSDTNPIPAIVSPSAPGRGTFKPGDTFTLTVGDTGVTVIVAGVRDEFPGIADEGSYAVAPLAWLRAALPRATLDATRAYLRAPDADPAALSRALGERWPPGALTSRQAAYEAVHGSPVVQAVSTGFLLVLAVAAAYAVLSVVIALTLTVSRRSRDLAYLRTMGLSRGQTLAALLVEHAPPLFIAVVGGAALGLGVAVLVAPALALEVFTGPGVLVPLQTDPLALGLLALGVVATLGIGVVAASVTARRVSPARILRAGEG